MTNAEMVESLNELRSYHKSLGSNKFYKALDRAVIILSSEPCDDVISRSAALESVEMADGPEVEFRIRRIPSASSQRRIGHWMHNEDNSCWVCSECKEENIGIPVDVGGEGKPDPYIWLCSKFCPCCGAKMEREK